LLKDFTIEADKVVIHAGSLEINSQTGDAVDCIIKIDGKDMSNMLTKAVVIIDAGQLIRAELSALVWKQP